jgi:hypothetical protein
LSSVAHERPSRSVIRLSSSEGVTDALAFAPFDETGAEVTLAAGEGDGAPFVANPIDADGNAMPVPPATILVDTFEELGVTLGDGERDGGGEGSSGAWKT